MLNGIHKQSKSELQRAKITFTEEEKDRKDCHSGRKFSLGLGCVYELSPRNLISQAQMIQIGEQNYDNSYPSLKGLGNMSIEQVNYWLTHIQYSEFFGKPFEEVQTLSYNDSIRYLAELIVLNHQYKSHLGRVSEHNMSSELSSASAFLPISVRDIDSRSQSFSRKQFSLSYSAQSFGSPIIEEELVESLNCSKDSHDSDILRRSDRIQEVGDWEEVEQNFDDVDEDTQLGSASFISSQSLASDILSALSFLKKNQVTLKGPPEIISLNRKVEQFDISRLQGGSRQQLIVSSGSFAKKNLASSIYKPPKVTSKPAFSAGQRLNFQDSHGEDADGKPMTQPESINDQL